MKAEVFVYISVLFLEV